MSDPVSIPIMTYEKDSLRVDIYTDAIVFHKNGLKMEVPLMIFVEIQALFDEQLSRSPDQAAEDIARRIDEQLNK